MWNKIYLLALAIFSLLMIAVTFYAYSWLQSPDNPVNVVANYDYFSNIAWMLLWISAAILLVLANVLLWTTRKAWAMWVTLLYFAIFALTQTFWLGETYFQYKQKNFPRQETFSFGSFLGVILCVLAAIIVFFNQFLVKRLHDKTFPAVPTAENRPELKTASEDKTI